MATSTPRLVTAALARLESALPALIVAEGQPAIREFLGHDPGVITATKAPQLWVSISGIRPGGPAAFGDTNANLTRTRTLLVGVTAAGADAAAADTALQTYADLILTTLESYQPMGGEAFRVAWMGTVFSANFQQGMALFREAVLTFEVLRWTGFGED